MHYDERTLLIRAGSAAAGSGGQRPRLLNRVTADQAGWQHLNFEVRRFEKGERWAADTGEAEAALVVLGGQCSVTSSRGAWARVGRRPNVFSGMPYALYLPRRTTFEVTALGDGLETAYGWVATDEDHPARLVTPADSEIEIRGGHSATRQINSIIAPGFDCHRLVVCEVYTP